MEWDWKLSALPSKYMIRSSPNRTAASLIARVILGALFAVLLSARAQACPICVAMPTKTVADHLIESETVVLARENVEKPFTYSVVKILKGEPPTEAFGLFVDSSTRRRLKFHPGEAVVLVRRGMGQNWQRLGIADEEYQNVVERILLFADRWTREGDVQHRLEFFLSLFGHKNRSIFELAYLELGRAPYEKIKQMAKFVSRDQLLPLLEQREYIEWRPLAILLLAQKADPRDRKTIEETFQSCQEFGATTNLAAWATAYIEIHGEKAVEEIEATYLRVSERSATEIRAVLMALSVHGQSARTQLRDRIVKSYGVALRFRPATAGAIAADLTQWEHWKHKEVVADILMNENLAFSSSEMNAVRNYILAAEREPSTPSN